MSDFFDKGLHLLGKNKCQNEIFAINIGSTDDIMFEELNIYKNLYNFKMLYVEPIQYLFEKLKTNVGTGHLFENSAISDYDGEIEMVMIDKDAINSGKVNQCYYGKSIVYPSKNDMHCEEDKNIVKQYGIKIKVPCVTFETLLKKHNITTFDILKMSTEGHDYIIFKQIDLNKYKPKVIRLEWINLSTEEKKDIIDTFIKYDYTYEILKQGITALSKSLIDDIKSNDKIAEQNSTSRITLVTGLWNIGRSKLKGIWSRTYQNYLDKFAKLLEVDVNMIIFGDIELKKFVFNKRKNDNTQFIVRNLDWFKNNEYYDKIQKIRVDPLWYNQIGWLKDSTQASLDMYNPIVMSKIFLLNDAKLTDKFNSEYMFWIDAQLCNTVDPGYLTYDKVLSKLPQYISKFTFITFPYVTNKEIHGFKYDKICEFANNYVNKVARGGFFGGRKESITQIKSIYYSFLMDTLNDNLMGTEESIFTIMLYRHPDLFNYIEILKDGLLSTFFEDLKNNNIVVKNIKTIDNVVKNNIVDVKVHLYVLTYNFPQQFECLVESFRKADINFLNKPIKFLLNNSTDRSTDEKYNFLCEKYGFEQIKKNNLGICGGRQFIAEHFDNSDADYYIFFEDDMFLHENTNTFCKSGFRNWVPNLYNRTLRIMNKENYDFLKLNFTEFYGSNAIQWAWYNVPDDVRIKYFPKKTIKPKLGLDPNPPLTTFTNIKTFEDISYIEGENYYCNWPLWFNKEGNRKVFLDPKFEHPYEQSLMSLVFQKQKYNLFRTAVLLLSPINHNRIYHYSPEERKEN